jgi:hypothetical protein
MGLGFLIGPSLYFTEITPPKVAPSVVCSLSLIRPTEVLGLWLSLPLSNLSIPLCILNRTGKERTKRRKKGRKIKKEEDEAFGWKEEKINKKEERCEFQRGRRVSFIEKEETRYFL